ncbi:MAG: phospholipase D family protein [Solirubrobacteraceae bacterium]
MDLLALLRVPLAATTLPWAAAHGEPIENPFALLTALRRNASKVSLFCHAGATKIPARHVGLLTFLEEAVHPVSPPRSGVFHPKVWLLRFLAEEDDAPTLHRLVVLSRNLTFDRSWDVALSLDGEVADRQRGYSSNRPLSDFIGALLGMAAAAGTVLNDRASRRIDLLADEVRRVVWELPNGFSDHRFHPIGHDGRPRWPIRDVRRLLVLSPFVGAPAIARLRKEVPEDLRLIGRFEELARLEPEVRATLDEIEVFDDPGSSLDVEDVPPGVGPGRDGEGDVVVADEWELSGLHAKLFVGKRGHRAVVYVGSANATGGAFEQNVEFMVELSGSHAQHGCDSVLGGLRDARLLTPFRGEAASEVDEVGEALQRELESLAHVLACGVLRATCAAVAEGRWQVSLHRIGEVTIAGRTLEARPLSERALRAVDLTAETACRFPPTSLASLTSFFAMRLIGRSGTTTIEHDFCVQLPLEGAPAGRCEAVTAELLSDRERLLRFILLLLADDGQGDRMLDELVELLAEEHVGVSAGGSAATTEFGLPLLEPILRALHRSPERLDELDRLLCDLRTAGASTEDLLPASLQELWSIVQAARAELS